MPTLSALELFAVAAFALIVVPGPAVLYIVSQSVGHGRRGGLAAVVGVEIGAFVHVAGAALGVSAVHRVVGDRVLGAQVRRRRLPDRARHQAAAPARRRRRRGSRAARDLARRSSARASIVSALNPKTALFFLAFLPQFVDPERGHVALQATVLGLVFIAIATVSDAVWALGAGQPRAACSRRASARAAIERWASGGILIGLGVLATLAHPARRTS